MATSDEPAAAAGDPYATNKANLRDTIKWLAGIFGALAAVVIAGTPLSGLGALSWPSAKFILAGGALLFGFVCICLALIFTLRLLRADLLYFSDLAPDAAAAGSKVPREIRRLRTDIDKHKADLLPPGYHSMRKFLEDVDAAVAQASSIGMQWAQHAATLAPDHPQVVQAKAAYEAQVAALRDFRAYQQRILAYGSYVRFYNRLRRATPLLFFLGIAALLALMAFTVIAKAPAENKTPTVVVATVSGEPAPAPPPPVIDEPALPAIYFATGSAHISEAGVAAIQRARDELLAHPRSSLLLMAYTDTVGSSKLNDRLAQRRANAVKKMLTGPGGIAGSRVFTAELPKSHLPKVTDDNQEKMNNRAVFLYLVEFPR